MRSARSAMAGFVAALASVAACSASPSGASSDPSGTSPTEVPSGTTTATSPEGGPGAPPADCPDTPSRCDAWNVRARCVVSGTTRSWVTETCAAGCFAGACSATACADECVLGASCKLWDMKTSAYVEANAANKLHDRARDYDRILHAMALPEGQVMNARFPDASFAKVSRYEGYYDAAIWTGSALAAQAFRLIATRSPDAESQVQAIVKTLHRDLTISGDVGYLARAVVRTGPAGTPLAETNHCANPDFHCNVTWQGASYDWLGQTSRDQYTGVILGYALAYQATTDEPTKKTIREDLVTITTELMKVRTVPAVIVVNGLPLQKTLTLENVILAPSEMDAGRVRIDLSSANPGESKIVGMRELFPDYSVVVKQALGVSIPIPRASTAIIIGAIFRATIAATEGVPAMKAQHDTILAYYQAHAAKWLDVAAGWSFSANCGNGYFANHLAVIMAYTWAVSETDASLLPRIRDEVFDGKLWSALGGHKNPYFAFLWGGARALPSKSTLAAAMTQLGQFEPGPRLRVARALTTLPRYLPHDTTCTSPMLCDTNTLAVDVSERTVDDFLWQRHPWQLEDSADPLLVYPGVDYLAAYWAARRHGFTADDREGTCTRLAP